MASTTTYTCDRCGSESVDVSHLKCVSVRVVNSPSHREPVWKDDSNRYAEWCYACLAETGVWKRRDPETGKNVEPEEETTLEELIRQIVREEQSEC